MDNFQFLKGKSNPGPGCPGHIYAYEDLPEDYQRAVLAHMSGLKAWEIPEAGRPLEVMENELKAFGALLPKYQAIARARALILSAVADYSRANGLGQKKGRAAFCRLYLDREAPGITPEVYKLCRLLSVATLELWMMKLNKGGLAGLAPHSTNSGRASKLSPEAQMFIRATLAEKPGARSNHILAVLRANLPSDEIVHKATLNRWIKKWREKNKAEEAMNLNPIEYKGHHQAAFGTTATAPFAGYTWEMDSTPADVQTADGRRCTITAAIDVYSRRAVVVVANTSNSLTVASCIRQGLLTWGRPEIIKKDNGADFSSRHIEAITTGLGIETPKLPPYTPEAKGHIERFFHTLSHELEEMLPGFTGHSVADRAALRAKNTWARKVFERPQDKAAVKAAVDIPLTQGELMNLISCWLEVYENRVHSGFAADPGRPLKGLTPLQAFEKSARRPRPITNERMLDVLLAPVGMRQVGKRGISWQGARYVAPELVPYIKHDVELRLHPQDAGSVYVFLPGNKFVCVASCRALEGQALADYMAEKKREKKRIQDRIRAAWVLAQNLEVKYTDLLASGRILESLKAMEAPRPPESDPATVIEFNPAFENQATLEAAKAARAYDNPQEPQTLPLIVKPVIDFEAAKNRIIHPVSGPQEEFDPAYPTGKDANNPILKFEYWLKREKRVGLYPDQVKMLFHLWDEYRAVQKFHPRPNAESLNIITPPPATDETPDQKREIAL